MSYHEIRWRGASTISHFVLVLRIVRFLVARLIVDLLMYSLSVTYQIVISEDW